MNYIIVKIVNVQKKKGTLKEARERAQGTYKGRPVKIKLISKWKL